jgi:uncharacterized damage-inducible protein DinB
MEIRSAGQFLEYWTGFRGRTRRVIECIPPEGLEWSPRAGAFTFGDMIRHLATIERYMYAETVAGRPSRYPGCGRELADGYQAVLEYLDRLDGEAKAIIAALTDADLLRKCRTPAGTPITVWKWLRAMVEHEAHHRGQMYLMLNLLQVPAPPLFGLTSEEVRARSVYGSGRKASASGSTGVPFVCRAPALPAVSVDRLSRSRKQVGVWPHTWR